MKLPIPSQTSTVVSLKFWNKFWISNFILHIILDAISLSMLGLKLNHVRKRGPKSYGIHPVLLEYSDFSRNLLKHIEAETK